MYKEIKEQIHKETCTFVYKEIMRQDRRIVYLCIKVQVPKGTKVFVPKGTKKDLWGRGEKREGNL